MRRMPLGISIASHSRFRSINSYIVLSRLLGGNRFLLAFQSSLQRVPGQSGALHPRRELGNSRENCQLAKFRLVAVAWGLAGYHLVKTLE